MCAEGLSALLNNFTLGYVDRGVRVCNRSPWITHLLFADDSLIFVEASPRGAARLNVILNMYNEASGQLVNREKSSIFFSPGIAEDRRVAVKEELNIQVEAFSEKYLGLPTAVGKLTSEVFDYIAERIRSKLNGRSERNLSYAAKEVLIKSVIQAMPTYSMACFLLGKGTIQKLVSLMAQFWWSGSLDKRSMHWMAWDKIAVPKEWGGMGFRELHLFNLALLGKQGWRLMSTPNSLCAQVLRGRYYPGGDFMSVEAPRTASKTWRAILAGRMALQVGLIHRIGSGNSISIWNDSWIPGAERMRPMGKLQETDKEYVHELFLPDVYQWDEQLVRSIFLAPDADRIMQIPLPQDGGEDRLAWDLEQTGLYSVKSAYRGLVSERDQLREAQGNVATTSSAKDGLIWRKLWKLDVQPRVRVFWWRVLKGILPDYATLARRHVRVQSTCPVCKSTSESLYHALVECTHAQLFWTAAKDAFNLKLPNLHPETWAEDVLTEVSFQNLDREMAISLMASIWDSRNKWSHDDHGFDPKSTVEFISETLVLLQGFKSKKGKAKKPLCTWKAPPVGVVKLNSDGAIRIAEGLAASGGVARDGDGFRSAWCKLYRGISDPLTIEALALRDAIVQAKIQGFQSILAETDCSELVKLWLERGSHRARIGPIISEISDLSRCFRSFELVFARRSANNVAHECARYACAHGMSMEWLVESPQFLSYSLMADCNSAGLS
jgi:ribonuclease HI